MSTKVLERHVVSRDKLADEVQRLRSLVIGLIGRDPEGMYRQAYVRRLLAIASKPSTNIFKDAKSFLKELSDTV